MILQYIRISLEKYAPDDFFIWLDTFFKLTGFLPPTQPIKKIAYLIFAVPWILTCTLLLVILELINIYQNIGVDFKSKMMYISLATFDIIVVLRILIYILTTKEFEKIKDVIRRPINFECFRIKSIAFEEASNILKKEKISLNCVWKKVQLNFAESSEIEIYCKNTSLYTRLLCCGFSTTLLLICSSTCVIWNGFDTYAEVYENFNPYLNKTSLYRKQQLGFYFPFDTSLEGYYWLSFFLQFVCRLGVLLLFIPIESALISSIFHLISQTRIVQEAFKYIDKNICPKQNSRNVFLIKHIRIVKCINELQQIYGALEMLEDFCTVQMMIQYGIATFLLCTLGYVSPMVTTLGEAYCCFVFLSASLGDIFIFSFICQSLTKELQDIGEHLYNTEWPFYPNSIKKNVLFLLKRLQKPACLTAGKIFKIDLLLFLQIVQRAYSFYTLISQTRKT